MPPKTGRASGRQKAASKTKEPTTAEEENVLESGEDDQEPEEAEAGPSDAAPATVSSRKKRKPSGIAKGGRRPRPSNVQRMSFLYHSPFYCSPTSNLSNSIS